MPLLELIYTSHANGEIHASDITNILTASEKNNSEKSLTGLLLFDGRTYIQILEGERKDVEKLFEVIGQDSRHRNIEILHKGEIADRSFANWRMAYEEMPQGLLESLAEGMGVYSLELGDEPLRRGESFGAKLNGMFMDAIAAE